MTTHNEVKQLIIKALELEDIAPDDIANAAPLFGEGLGLDSIDALEIGIAIKKAYDLTLSAEDEDNRKHFFSIDSLVQFINSKAN